ncbi:MAG: FecR domain-containing protein [Lentisphaerae bacterium]|nr:FecR domain-containing protein [Lentisphaerota bacterium]
MRNNEPGAGSARARDTGLFAQLPPDDLEETAAEKLRKSGIFAAAPGPDAGTDNNHLSLSELRELHEQRRRLGTDWEMPEHLATCSLCLEIFQCLQDGLPELSEAAAARFEGLFRPEERPAGMRGAKFQRAARILKMAAAILLLAAGAALIWQLQRPAARLDSGAFVIERDNRELVKKAELPANTLLVAREEAGAVFDGGATALFASGSRVMIKRSPAGETTINLQQGDVEASVPKQKPGRHFKVQTPLGDVRVIGTRFRVSTESEKVMVYESSGESQNRTYIDRISAVTVQVESGVVAVDNHYDHVNVAAGQCAVMREGQKLIEVRGTAR